MAHTVTFQTSYFIRSARVWNELPSSNRLSETLYQFKCKLFMYYNDCLRLSYNIDDPRTWKTVCPKYQNCVLLNSVKLILNVVNFLFCIVFFFFFFFSNGPLLLGFVGSWHYLFIVFLPN